MPFNMHWPEIVLILVIVLVIFGAGKLPQIGGAIGKSIKEFRKSRSIEDEDDKKKDKAAAITGDTQPKEKANHPEQ